MVQPISKVIEKQGVWQTHFNISEVEVLKEKFGTDSQAELREAMLRALGVEPSKRMAMTEEQKQARQLEKLAEAKGISSEKLAELKAIFGIN